MKFIAALVGMILLASIIWAFGAAPFWESGAEIVANPWGLVTLFDLYTGFFLIAIIIWFAETTIASRLLWIVPLFFLGNIWSALWLVLRWNHVTSRLKGRV